MSDLAVAVLVGGRSSRMGVDKAFVSFLGVPLVERVLAVVFGLGGFSVFLVGGLLNNYTKYPLPVFPDIVPHKGALGGIYSAVYHSPAPYTLVVACDMPFLNPALLRHMIALRDEQAGPYDVIVPRLAGHPQGLHAIYSKRCLEPIRTCLEENRLKVVAFYDRVRVRYLEPSEYAALDPRGLSFVNINTPDELIAAQRLASGDTPADA